MTTPEDKQRAKKAAGYAAAALIQNHMLIGLGTGSTAFFFIQRLIERCRQEHLQIKAVATSERSAKQAKEGGIELCDINTLSSLDLDIDGADEIDLQKRMIKGGGGALLREKIVASIAREMIIIIDQEKLVKQLGHFPLPLEIVQFAHQLTLKRILQLGYQGKFRRTKENELYLTDNGNYIIDISFPNGCFSPEQDQAILSAIPGVVETGFFFNLAGRVIVGQYDGSVKTI